VTDEDRWRRSEQPTRGPSEPTTVRFDPFATALGVFFAIAVPIVVVGYTRPTGVSGPIIAIGIVVGLVVGVLVGIWLAGRDGLVWRGRQL
jgi:hypothetical protein